MLRAHDFGEEINKVIDDAVWSKMVRHSVYDYVCSDGIWRVDYNANKAERVVTK